MSYMINGFGNIIKDKDGFHDERHIESLARITGTGALTASLLQFTGSVQIIEQYAKIVSKTTLTNATAVYADIWDGTVPTDLTLDGAVISGFSVESFFLKDQLASQTYSVLNADQARLSEVADSKKAGRPFIINAKPAVDNFIRFHLTTTDAPIDFTMEVHFTYRRLTANSSLAFV